MEDISKCKFLLPKRHVVVIMGTFALFHAYAIRNLLSLLMMTTSNPVNNTGTCPESESLLLDETIRANHPWDKRTQILIFNSFYVGYLVTPLPGGYLADALGGKHVLGLGILAASILSLVTPTVIRTIHDDYKYLMTLRLLEGLCEGTAHPALSALFAQWIPARERATATGLLFAGGQFGSLASVMVVTKITSVSKLLYFFGSFGVIWFVGWQLLCYSRPEQHPCIGHKEKEYLVRKPHKRLPLTEILCHGPFWALIFAEMGHQWNWFTLTTEAPRYVKEMLRFNAAESVLISSLPSLFVFVTALSGGLLSDCMAGTRRVSVTTTRKLFTTLGALLPTSLLMVVSNAGCDRVAAVTIYAFAVGAMGFWYCSTKANPLDLAPDIAGFLTATVNIFGISAGLCALPLADAFTPKNTQPMWRNVFWMAFFLSAFTTFSYLVFGSAEKQS